MLERRIPLWCLAGLVLGVGEVAVVAAVDRGLFLSITEFFRYVALALTAAPALVLGAGLLGSVALAVLGGDGPALPARAFRLAFALAAPLLALAAWELTAGRRVRDLPGRALLVIALGMLAAWVIARGVATLARRSGDPTFAVPASFWLILAALGALLLDTLVLRRLYPAFHLTLAIASVLGVAAAGSLWPRIAALSRRGVASVLAVGAIGGTLVALAALSGAPNARTAVEQSAPLSGKVLARWPRPRSVAAFKPASDDATLEQTLDTAPGLDLRGQDVLLITVDALRADRLRAFGGDGLTPALDALAERSVVFLRAYTSTPHTSYALASLMTAKFMRPLLMLSETTSDHPTLPIVLRRYGYRTAAFYPPAIFYVDEQRFDWLNREHLGFEYVKAMYAPAAARVAQLEAYLSAAEPGHPLFVWVHLFEPHEPYEPPAQFERGPSPRERYDGEVAAADAAIGDLVALFRRVRGEQSSVIVTSDHGEEFGEHGGHHHGTTLFDEQVRVPLVWSSPGAVPRDVAVPVETVDIGTTLLSGLGIPRDARMRGDDLTGVLAGRQQTSARYAFASIAELAMATDGHLKAICRADASCSLYDLVADPAEREDIAAQRPQELSDLHGALSAFIASVPRIEALTLGGEGAWPAALARARLGDPTAKAELLPLLGATRPEVRAAAARAVGELGVDAAAHVLSRLSTSDPDVVVRAEASVAWLELTGDASLEAVVALLAEDSSASADLRRRAAQVLARRGDASGAQVLLDSVADATLDESERIASIDALQQIASALPVEPLLPLLDEVRLRPRVAELLGRIGDRAAAPALAEHLESEPYPQARHAEARALIELGRRREALASIRRFLGTETSIPDGVGLLMSGGALANASGAGAELAHASAVRQGPWECGAEGCRPLPGAAIKLPRARAPRGPARYIVRCQVEASGRGLTLLGQRFWLESGSSEVAVRRDLDPGAPLAIEADPGVSVEAIAVVPVTQD